MVIVEESIASGSAALETRQMVGCSAVNAAKVREGTCSSGGREVLPWIAVALCAVEAVSRGSETVSKKEWDEVIALGGEVVNR